MIRENKSLQFALKSEKHPTNHTIFPLNPSTDTHNVRNREKFKVNKARTELYKNSTIPYLQRRLNDYYIKKDKLDQSRSRKDQARRGGGRHG